MPGAGNDQITAQKEHEEARLLATTPVEPEEVESPTREGQEAPEDAAVQGIVYSEAASKVRTTDKRRIRLDAPKPDPVESLINKTFAFIVNQPEYYAVLSAGRPARKRLERDIAKLLTRFPHFQKKDYNADQA